MNEEVIKALRLLVGEHYLIKQRDALEKICEMFELPEMKVRNIIKEEFKTSWCNIVCKILEVK